MPLKIGDKIPYFSAYNQFGRNIVSEDMIGKKAVLFFYPKDDTYVCTKEACSFRDAFSVFSKHDIQVFGISGDGVNEHRAFATKHSLNYTLLSDDQHSIRDLFGVPRSFLGLLPGRVTYCIDQEGIILSIINSAFGSEYHVKEALKTFKISD
jgi:peroxiredoxin Q/BCP